jgi:hypothetical protein
MLATRVVGCAVDGTSSETEDQGLEHGIGKPRARTHTHTHTERWLARVVAVCRRVALLFMSTVTICGTKIRTAAIRSECVLGPLWRSICGSDCAHIPLGCRVR